VDDGAVDRAVAAAQRSGFHRVLLRTLAHAALCRSLQGRTEHHQIAVLPPGIGAPGEFVRGRVASATSRVLHVEPATAAAGHRP